jgi:carbonic anhydrase/acetyltransferase-like protein (isoleucine patch superfamily)
MIRSFRGKTPRVAESAFVSEAAYIVGDVEIGENSGVWPGAVIRADLEPVKIGKNTHIEDNVVLHGGLTPIEIGDEVMIGHSAMVHARKIGNKVLIGANATILHKVEIGDSCVIAGGAVVIEGMKIPSNSFVTGVPAQVKGKVSSEQLWWVDIGPSTYAELIREYKEQGL